MKHIIILLFYISMSVVSLNAFPAIKNLSLDDPVYAQLQHDISKYHAAVHQNKTIPDLHIYQYKVPSETDILSLGARLNIPYEAIATLNGYSSNHFFNGDEILLVPNMPAVFARTQNPSDLDMLILVSRKSEEKMEIRIKSEPVIVFAGARFHPVERAMYLGVFFRYPVLDGYISSGYGTRTDPFSGHQAFHNGIDLAAPLGTPVVATRNGVVSAIENNDVLGIYIIIDHNSGYETLYGHLSKVTVRLNQEVHSGMIIGEVGLTGLTTGPHLHFEVRQRGQTKNPMLLLPKGQE